ncbi:baseplate multidomain protein megatron [Mesorhizobium australicum]|uniref:Putative phage tail protein n=1 Tax=Mesorhizobium australicum TaxID=536018 RepID=A0A1X7NXL4_9HYPH|nr:glycoside hydrolase/phage tail family protein [Mesorhizobium australicum]SMH42558.1 Putative phage tail protein [Mesorhizobium australicum]
MATLVFGLVGKWIGGSLLGALGTIAGRVVDQMLFSPTIKREGPRLSDLTFSASTEGAPVPRVWGRMRISTQVIWATRYKEEKKTTTSGGKGGPRVKTTEYLYSVSMAVGLCEGEIAGVGRVWADGKVIRLDDYNHRVHLGTEDQEPDPLIAEIEGEDRTPAFRGTAYLVFEDMPLEKFGNRAPQITVEVIRRPAEGAALEDMMRAVTLIPGTTEFGYATTPVFLSEVDTELDDAIGENQTASNAATDLVISLDRLQAEAPAVQAVALVVAWHGTDLRCGECEIRPKVEATGRNTKPFEWRVADVTRGTALVVSQYGGSPAAGGAPSDRSVYEAIVELKGRGFEVTLYPFMLMDIPAGNELPDPYGGDEQAAFPWRGRITCHPAPGEPGTADKTSAAADQVAAFFGTASAADFGWNAAQKCVTYSGPDEWSFRRHILHLAAIAAASGGLFGGDPLVIDRFLIGSEMVGLTSVRSSSSSYPAVAQLIDLAAEVRELLGEDTLIGYAADWSEYHSHRPADGSGDVFFNLDPLWSDDEIDFIGIDNYLPLADWRDDPVHLDKTAGAASIYDLDYLRSNVEGGEYFDWYYTDQTARDAQDRTPIVDGAEGKHWVFRQKDFRAWWSEAHHDRPAGVEAGSPTAWAPQSKPIVFTELGCPAVDKGANQPNVFVDPKSSESHLPYYSRGRRDDRMQRAYLEAVLSYWSDDANNPASGEYDGRMVDVDHIHLWTWDARPWPEFPQFASLWADAANWRLGHWLSGRLGAVSLRDVVADIGGGYGVELDTGRLAGLVSGYQLDQVMTARSALEPLARTYFFDAYESGETLRFRHRGETPAASFARADLVVRDNGDFALTRAQESELPRGVDFSFYLPEADYRQAAVRSRRLAGASRSIEQEGAAIAFSEGRAGAIADTLLFEAHAARERAEFTLPPSALALDAGDAVALTVPAGGGARKVNLKLGVVGLDRARTASGTREDASVYDQDDGPETPRALTRPKATPPPVFRFLDIPLLRDAEAATAHAPRVAAWSSPWQSVSLFRAAAEGASLGLDTEISDRADMGKLAQAFYRGPLWIWDEGNDLVVDVAAGVTLASATEIDVLSGANTGAVHTGSDRWEILQWRTAELIATRRYRLTGLLRGQRGSDADMVDEVPIGAAFVVLDVAVTATGLPAALALQPNYWRWGPAGKASTDALYEGATKTFAAVGLRPLSPVHLGASWETDGDIQIGWTRRTRIGGDGWEQVEVPLGEESETYEVEILDTAGASVVRTVSGLGAPAWLYTVADQTADHGAPLTSIRFRVYQMSATIGRGAMAEYP